MSTKIETGRIIRSAYCDQHDCIWDADHHPDELVQMAAEQHAEKTGHRVGLFTQTTKFISKEEG